jgi:hypothetical protein
MKLHLLIGQCNLGYETLQRWLDIQIKMEKIQNSYSNSRKKKHKESNFQSLIKNYVVFMYLSVDL